MVLGVVNMKKILIIISIMFVSLFGINKLKADVYVSNRGSLHYYSGTNLKNWIIHKECGDGNTCYLPFLSNITTSSFYYNSNILPEILKKDKIYDIYFTFSIRNIPEDYTSLHEKVSNIHIGTITSTTPEDSKTVGAEVLSWIIESYGQDIVTIKATFKVTSNPNNFLFGVSFDSSIQGLGWGYSVNQIFQIEQNLNYTIDNNLGNIQDKQDQTNEKLDNIDNTLKDDEIDTDGANSFFDDFNSKDHGGLSSIITSPLSALMKITDTCTPIKINVLEKEITLPCGDTLFWNKPNVESFRIIWNILIGGPILYALLVKLYHVIEGLKNPDDDRIEVMKL